MPFDDPLMALLNRGAANPLFDWLMPRITNLHQQGLFLVAVLTVAIAILWRGTRRGRIAVVCALVAVGVTDLTAARVVKKIVARERPCRSLMEQGPPANPAIRLAPGTHCPGSRSFPSNHAANMMAFATVGWWFTRGRARWLWLLFPLVIGYSRIYLGFHYATDILGGYLIGGTLAAAVLTVAGRYVPIAAEPAVLAGSEEPPDAEHQENGPPIT